MKVAEFYLINENKEKFSLMDYNNYCWLREPKGLGYSYIDNYEQINNAFINRLRKLEQGIINGTGRFKNYDNYKKFVNFVELSKKIRFGYKIPFKDLSITYYKNVEIKSVSKSYILDEDEPLDEEIQFNCLTMWYQDQETVYTVGDEDIIWDFVWDSHFADYRSRSIIFENDGHTTAPLQFEMSDYLINPKVYVLFNEEKIFELELPSIENGEKIMYSSKEMELYYKKQNLDGTFTNLFKEPYVDINKNNMFELPKGTSEIVMEAENDILNAKLNLLPQYKVV